MIIKALNTFTGILDLSSLERMQESNPFEKYPFRLYIRPGESVTVDDRYYNLTSVQNAIAGGYIEVGDISSDNTTIADMSYAGTTQTYTAGEALIEGEAVYYNSDGKVYKAKADSDSTMICIGITTASASADSSVVLLVRGLIRNSTLFSFTVGGQASVAAALVYISESTAGRVTQTRPSTSTNIVQIIGFAEDTDTLSFDPDNTFIEIA